MARDYYEVLGVGRNASAEEIQQAYRRLARRHHPDVNSDPSAEERFKEVNEAYQVLSDPQTRSRYDAFGPDFQRVPEDVDPGVYARAGGDAGQQRRWWNRAETRPDFDEAGFDFEDLFGSLFGGRRAGGPLRGADQQADLELSVEEAYRGGTRHITLSGPQGPREYDVTIPAGVVEDQRIRLAGQGAQGEGGGPPGDLYFTVRIAPHPRYRLVGRDIHVDLRVAPWEAALGATVPLTTPGGETKVRVVPGTSSGQRLRLRGEGMLNPKGTPGDLYAKVRIMVPPTLAPRERALFEELAAASDFDPRR
ncbi:J domain-containing protein [Streptomonospora wellingtoniae]|uniref:J domain-containing protein n=1 Tax=Streptomonospora wellingtoniae TaxID=3075544 RepID=A0ABU2KPV2_9ACTN|nr:J domain-containing protein [Streptomonospora sp. DSM 45055]MDT0301302.1 J domain-containing protein [Streptomonospora sp. DSM 45055]